MDRKLSSEQIDDLYKFCEEQDVKYYDVQLELVDHLAAAIEQKWNTNPKLSYEKALWSVFDQFGASGFRKIKSNKEKELQKKYKRIKWKYIGEFFKLPKIVLTIMITFLIFSILDVTNLNLRTSTNLILVYCGLLLAFLAFIYPRISQLHLKPGKSFLLYEQMKVFRKVIYVFGFMPLFMRNLFQDIWENSVFTTSEVLFMHVVIAFLITFFSIMMFVIAYYIPKRIKEDFTREFPQFVKS